ncbi:hypothetical protein F5Y15DRAFT_334775 [Xylariaceae sp. FL0016]|nr:hypothetical protein F5Y15DRAFT_334775 [Xylariaceae sp. FL0016]
MSSPQLAIARVSFSAVLLRADPTPCTRPDIDQFLALLDATIARCSPPNVQKCRQWILANLAPSPTRVAALLKYLTALANSFDDALAATRQAREPSTKRKRLHVLYILNDALHHALIRHRDLSFAAKLEPGIPDLVRGAAAFPNSPKHTKKIQQLLSIWTEAEYFAPDFMSNLQTIVLEAPHQDTSSITNGSANEAASAASKLSKDAPFIMPSMHGDASSLWYDLPAANWLPVIEPNSSRPMNPDMIRPLQFAAGPADKELIAAVQNLLADVDRIYAKRQDLSENPLEDIDQLGQRVVLDEINGDVIGGDTYYGWSRTFCNKMKQRRKPKDGARSERPARSMSRSQSRDSSYGSPQPAFKRRRMSSSRSPGRSRSRSRSRDYDRHHGYSRERGRQGSYDSSRSRSPSRDRGRRFSRSPPRGHPKPQFQQQQTSFQPQHPPPAPPDFAQFLVPPPPPPNYQGQWPPPPPPPPPGGVPPAWFPGMPAIPPMPAMTGAAGMNSGGWSAPIPPPQSHPHRQDGGGFQNGRGSRDNHRGGYRGGWNRGRGW